MGGEGSGRKPDIAKRLIEMRMGHNIPFASTNSGDKMVLPDYSGVAAHNKTTVSLDGRYVNITGDTMTGHLQVPTLTTTGEAFILGDLNISGLGDLVMANALSENENRIHNLSDAFVFDIVGTDQVRITDGTFEPMTDSDIDLGTTSKRFETVFTDNITMGAGTGFVKAATGVFSTSATVDISADTNLSATSPIVLAGDTLSFSGSNKGAVMHLSAARFSPADAVTLYIGCTFNDVPQTTDGARRMYIPLSGTIKAAYVNVMVTGTLGTTETSTCYLRINSTTDVTISSSVACNAINQVFSNTGLSTAVSQGDFIEFKWVTPTWVTNPTNVFIHTTLYIE